MSEQTHNPHVIVLAGPNGAGKSTAAPKLLPHLLGIGEFVNADVIAAGLSAFAPEKVAIKAGRIMLRRLDELAAARANFAFETTLTTRRFAPRLAGLKANGYRIELVYFYLPSAEMAVERVAQRVRRGGHDVPADTVRRRYARSLHNLVELFLPIADRWHVYNNAVPGVSPLIAHGVRMESATVVDRQSWDTILGYKSHDDQDDGH